MAKAAENRRSGSRHQRRLLEKLKKKYPAEYAAADAKARAMGLEP